MVVVVALALAVTLALTLALALTRRGRHHRAARTPCGGRRGRRGWRPVVLAHVRQHQHQHPTPPTPPPSPRQPQQQQHQLRQQPWYRQLVLTPRGGLRCPVGAAPLRRLWSARWGAAAHHEHSMTCRRALLARWQSMPCSVRAPGICVQCAPAPCRLYAPLTSIVKYICRSNLLKLSYVLPHPCMVPV